MRTYEEGKIRNDLKNRLKATEKTLSFLKADTIEQTDRRLQKVLKGKWHGKTTECETVYIRRDDDTDLRLLVIRRKNHCHTDCTGFLWCHGGGFAFGLAEMEVTIADTLTKDDECVMVLPDYRKSYEAQYPAAVEDCYLALKWMYEHASQLEIRSDQLFVGGEGAGGALAIALTLMARDRKEVSVAFQMPLFPMIDDENDQKEDMPFWTIRENKRAWRLYKGQNETTDVYYAPVRNLNYGKLPPAFTMITDNDLFAKETEDYFDHLYLAGVSIMIRRYSRCFHAFNLICPSAKISQHANRLIFRTFVYARENFFAYSIDTEVTEPVENADDVVTTMVGEHIDTDLLSELIEQTVVNEDEEPVDYLEEAEELMASIKEQESDELDDLSAMIERNVVLDVIDETDSADITEEDIAQALEDLKAEHLHPFEEKEDVLGNLQKIIEEDTTTSLQIIEDLVDQM